MDKLNPFHASIFALMQPDLAAAMNDAFADLDLIELTSDVLTDTTPANRMTVIRALDDVFGNTNDLEDGTE